MHFLNFSDLQILSLDFKNVYLKNQSLDLLQKQYHTLGNVHVNHLLGIT